MVRTQPPLTNRQGALVGIASSRQLSLVRQCEAKTCQVICEIGMVRLKLSLAYRECPLLGLYSGGKFPEFAEYAPEIG
jgi:hypothetical protein